MYAKLLYKFPNRNIVSCVLKRKPDYHQKIFISFSCSPKAVNCKVNGNKYLFTRKINELRGSICYSTAQKPDVECTNYSIQKEYIWTVPNMLCVLRVVMAPCFTYFMVTSNFPAAIVVTVIAAISDFADGFIARSIKNQSSRLGSFLDPLADKIFITTLFITLAYTGLFPVWLMVLVIARDVILFSAGCYIRYLSISPPKSARKFFSLSNSTAQLMPTFSSKVNTGVQLITGIVTVATTIIDANTEVILQALWFSMSVTTVISALSYLNWKSTYKIFTKGNKG